MCGTDTLTHNHLKSLFRHAYFSNHILPSTWHTKEGQLDAYLGCIGTTLSLYRCQASIWGERKQNQLTAVHGMRAWHEDIRQRFGCQKQTECFRPQFMFEFPSVHIETKKFFVSTNKKCASRIRFAASVLPASRWTRDFFFRNWKSE